MAAPFEKWKLEVVAKHFKLDLDSSQNYGAIGDIDGSSIELKEFDFDPSYDLSDFHFLYDESKFCDEDSKHVPAEPNGEEKVTSDIQPIGDIKNCSSCALENISEAGDEANEGEAKEVHADSIVLQFEGNDGDSSRNLIEDAYENVSCNKTKTDSVVAVKSLDLTTSAIEEKPEQTEGSFVRRGRNCASFILIWEKGKFSHKFGGKRDEGITILRNILQALSQCLCSLPGDVLKFECQSTIGNQVRKDFIFSTGEQAKSFVEKVKESVVTPENVTLKAYLLSEEYFGLKHEPVLTEADVLLLVKENRPDQLFRHFLCCKILTVGDKITFRFNNLSDINLFLYNKAIALSKTLGQLKKRSLRQQLKLEPNQEGFFTLHSNDLSMRHKEWEDLETRFMFSTRRKAGTKDLLFKNKRDLFYFFASKDAKVLSPLWLTKSQIVLNKPKIIKKSQIDARKLRKSQIVVNKPENLEKVKKLELLLKDTKEKEMKFRSQLSFKEKELRNVNSKILKKEMQTKAQKLVIQELKQELRFSAECIPCTLKLNDVLRLQFKEENESSSNYIPCLRSFLQTDILEKLDVVDEEIILKFSTSSKLEKLITSQCWKKWMSWSEVSDLPKRADFVPSKLYGDFGLLVYLEETSLLVKSIKQVEDELLAGQAKVEYRSFGFAARFPTLMSFMQALVNRELYSHHRVLFMQENVSFMGGNGHVKFFNGKVCLTEEDFLKLEWKSEENCSLNPCGRLQNFVDGLSSFLRNSKIEKVSLDWNNNIVLTFPTQQDLELLLKAHCVDQTNSLFKLSSLPVNFSYVSIDSRYSLRCPPDVDVRNFFMIDDSSLLSQDPVQISSKSRIFPFLCLSNPDLRVAYPSLHLQFSNFVDL